MREEKSAGTPEADMVDNPRNRVKRGWVGTYLTVAVIVVVIISGWLGLVYFLGTLNPVMVVEGDSMLPTLTSGDLVVVRGTSIEKLVEGYQRGERSIIVFYSPAHGKHIVHRIQAVVYDENGQFLGFRTKGDNNYMADIGMVNSSNLVGMVVYHIPYVGMVITFLRTTTGIFIVGIIIVLLALWSAVEEKGKRPRTSSPNGQIPGFSTPRADGLAEGKYTGNCSFAVLLLFQKH